MEQQMHRIMAESQQKMMEAKREYDIEAQLAKVRALAKQAESRLNDLNMRVFDAIRQVQTAEDQPAPFYASTFGHDTATLDALLLALGEASAELNQQRMAKDTTDAVLIEVRETLDNLPDDDDGGEQRVAEVGAGIANGQYL